VSVLIVIPARYASTRYPGKPLVPLKGAGGVSKSLLERSWLAAQQVEGDLRIVVATDDDRIKAHAEGFGAEVVMTSSECRNGTERCAEAHSVLGTPYDVVVNLQGDAPLTPPWFVDRLIAEIEDPKVAMATPVLRCDGRALAGFKADRQAGTPLTPMQMMPRRLCFIMLASMLIAQGRCWIIKPRRSAFWSSSKGWNNCGS